MTPARRLLRTHSTVIALLLLLFGFELLGRLAEAGFFAELSSAVRGEGAFSAAVGAAWEGVKAPDFAFLTPRNLTNLSLQVAINGVLAVGMTLVILTGGIDLSIGSVVALSSVALGLADAVYSLGLFPSLAIALLTGALAGAVNGALISRFQIAPFIITLGMLVIARGAALILSGSAAISPLSEHVRFLGGGFLSGGVAGFLLAIALCFQLGTLRRARLGPDRASWASIGLLTLLGGSLVYAFGSDRGVPVPFLVMVALASAGAFLCRRTVFGRAVYAVGGNEAAAILAGLDVRRTKFFVYLGMGILAGMSGVLLSGRLNSATPTEGQLMELDAIASVVIGGTSLRGGLGGIGGSIVGAFLIGTMNNGMDMLEISSNWQMIAKGLIIIVAVYSDARFRR